MIGISSDHLSSLAIYSGRTTHSFNFADLNRRVPASVWLAQLMCQPTTDCFPIRDDYRPWLAVPNEIRTVDLAWEDCDLADLRSFDPPQILVPAQVLASPTSARILTSYLQKLCPLLLLRHPHRRLPDLMQNLLPQH